MDAAEAEYLLQSLLRRAPELMPVGLDIAISDFLRGLRAHAMDALRQAVANEVNVEKLVALNSVLMPLNTRIMELTEDVRRRLAEVTQDNPAGQDQASQQAQNLSETVDKALAETTHVMTALSGTRFARMGGY
jgi:hypothetical protein